MFDEVFNLEAMKKNNKFRYWLVFVIISIVILFFSTPHYLKEAVIHLFPDVDDYKIFYNRIVETDETQSMVLSKSIIDVDAVNDDGFLEYSTLAYLIVQNDTIRYEKYWENFDSVSLINSFSMAKTIVSLLVGISIDLGKIATVDQKVYEFLPEFKNCNDSLLTIRDLLTMSSGLDWDEAYSSPFSKTTQAYYGNDLKSLHLNLDVVENPGQNFNYYSANTQLLSFIVEVANQKSLSSCASDFIWKKIGAEKDALWSLDDKGGEEKAYCCFNSNARDFAKIGLMVLHNGYFNGNQIVSSSYISEMIKPCNYLKDENGEEVDFYGYHIWLLRYKNQIIPYFRGILGQYIFIIPSENAVIVRLGKKRAAEKAGVHPIDVYFYLDEGMRILKK